MAMIKKIKTKAKYKNGHLIPQEDIGISEGSDVEIIILSKEDISYEDDEASLDEDMLKLAANNPAFDFLKDPREDIYTIDDLKERYQ